MDYIFKKSLMVAGLITIGSDGVVSDGEMDILHNFLKANSVSSKEEQQILKEITPDLGTAKAKGALLKEVTGKLSEEEKKKLLKACCALMFGDMSVKESEIKTLSKIGMAMLIPESVVRGIINQEMARF